MKKSILSLVLLSAMLSLGTGSISGQEIKTNAPLILAGTPNIGLEWKVGSQFSVNGDIFWMPYMFKKDESVFRALVGSADFRYYVKPRYYYTHSHFDGFYIGPYAMMGNYNIGLVRNGDAYNSHRYVGWGISGGVSLGYKFYISKRLRLDVNLGLGYAHLQHDEYRLGGEFSEYPEFGVKNTVAWVGPTKFGVHLGYIIYR